MERQRRRDTRAETEVRRRLHALGYRYRLDVKLEADLKARGDIVWKGRKVVVFIDGCFWHVCPEHGTFPKSNADWWRAKLRANVARDQRYTAELRERGWTVMRFWEHDDPGLVVASIVSQLQRPRR
jgi:DNA mismatch endonuclease (patch repair protein)